MMLILCSECGHRLRAEVGGIGAFGMLDSFDARAGSDTNGEQITRCPGCGLWLYHGFGTGPGDAAQPGQKEVISYAFGAGRG